MFTGQTWHPKYQSLVVGHMTHVVHANFIHTSPYSYYINILFNGCKVSSNSKFSTYWLDAINEDLISYSRWF